MNGRTKDKTPLLKSGPVQPIPPDFFTSLPKEILPLIVDYLLLQDPFLRKIIEGSSMPNAQEMSQKLLALYEKKGEKMLNDCDVLNTGDILRLSLTSKYWYGLINQLRDPLVRNYHNDIYFPWIDNQMLVSSYPSYPGLFKLCPDEFSKKKMEAVQLRQSKYANSQCCMSPTCCFLGIVGSWVVVGLFLFGAYAAESDQARTQLRQAVNIAALITLIPCVLAALCAISGKIFYSLHDVTQKKIDEMENNINTEANREKLESEDKNNNKNDNDINYKLSIYKNRKIVEDNKTIHRYWFQRYKRDKNGKSTFSLSWESGNPRDKDENGNNTSSPPTPNNNV